MKQTKLQFLSFLYLEMEIKSNQNSIVFLKKLLERIDTGTSFSVKYCCNQFVA